MMLDRLQARVAFGKPPAGQSVRHDRIAEARCLIDQARRLDPERCAPHGWAGNKVARAEIAMIEVTPTKAL